MATVATSQNIQELAANFANTLMAQINATVAETIGVDVLWFRAMPDLRSQDVIFQTYTLYGVEACPLEFKAVYMDNSYDDAAITYNIMGLEYSVPLTLDIAVNTWYEVTNHDGTLPQRGDIVYIPLSNKLMEVVSMTPVKKVAAQVSSYKVNLSIYKPTRSRIVGEDLKESIQNNTVNLDSQFGKEIKETFENIVDEPQTSIFNTTSVDRDKKNSIDSEPGSIIKQVNNIIESNLIIDGHTVSRSYYDMSKGNGFTIKYTHKDIITSESVRCYSSWFNIMEPAFLDTKNIQKMSLNENILTIESTRKFMIGDKVTISRGEISVVGTVTSLKPYTVELNPEYVRKLNDSATGWYMLPGYTIEKSRDINLLSSNNGIFKMDLRAGRFLSLTIDGKEKLFKLSDTLKYEKWYGIIVNLGTKISIDIYSEETEQLMNLVAIHDQKNSLWKDMTIDNYYIGISYAKITNIRLYDTLNTEPDKQIMDLVTYMIPNDSHAIVNDSVGIYLDKKFVGVKG